MKPLLTWRVLNCIGVHLTGTYNSDGLPLVVTSCDCARRMLVSRLQVLQWPEDYLLLKKTSSGQSAHMMKTCVYGEGKISRCPSGYGNVGDELRLLPVPMLGIYFESLHRTHSQVACLRRCLRIWHVSRLYGWMNGRIFISCLTKKPPK